MGGEEVVLCQLRFCLLLTAVVDWIESVSGKSLRMSLPQRFRWDVQGGSSKVQRNKTLSPTVSKCGL